MDAVNNTEVEASLALDSVKTIFQTWREHKKQGDTIPESLWQQVFSLEEKGYYTRSQLGVALGISTKQFKSKKAILNQSTSKAEPPEFCEVKTEPLYKPRLELQTNTVIVEFFRDDGKRMQIHMLTDSFKAIIDAFYAGEIPHASAHT